MLTINLIGSMKHTDQIELVEKKLNEVFGKDIKVLKPVGDLFTTIAYKFPDIVTKVLENIPEIDLRNPSPEHIQKAMGLISQDELQKAMEYVLEENFGRIEQSEVIIIVNPEGKVGDDTMKEVVEANRQGKLIYSTHLVTNPELNMPNEIRVLPAKLLELNNSELKNKLSELGIN